MNMRLQMMVLTTLVALVLLMPRWGRQAAAQGSCTDTAACAGSEYCVKAPGNCDGQGSCAPRPDVCTGEVSPVCGCDGRTYNNACVAAAAGVNVDHAGACLGISFEPAAQTVTVGQVVTVNVVVSGLGTDSVAEIVSTFDLEVRYDPAILAPTGVTFSSLLANGSSSLQAVNLATAGTVDFAELSLWTDLELESTQPDRFVLATLAFTARAAGTSPLSFIFDHRNDLKGHEALMLLPEVQSGSVTVNAPAALCYVDGDSDIDRNDINAIFAARNTAAAPGDPRDADGDGRITSNDARICTLRCTRPQCAP